MEIGTAHGGGTISMALAAKAGGFDCRIVTVDTLQSISGIPSSRSKWGSVQANEQIVRKNFQDAAVDDLITLFVGTSDEYARTENQTEQIDMLVLDADGRIDRDLLLFGPHLRDGAILVIDDVDGGVKLSGIGDQKNIDLKHVISEKLLNHLKSAGYLTEESRKGSTAFCRALEPEKWSSEELKDIALKAYRELIFLPTSRQELWRRFGAPALRGSPMGQVLWPLLRGPVRLVRPRR